MLVAWVPKFLNKIDQQGNGVTAISRWLWKWSLVSFYRVSLYPQPFLTNMFSSWAHFSVESSSGRLGYTTYPLSVIKSLIVCLPPFTCKNLTMSTCKKYSIKILHLNVKIWRWDNTFMSTLSKGMVLSTLSSSPMTSKLNKSTVVWFTASRIEYSGKHCTFTVLSMAFIFAKKWLSSRAKDDSLGLVVTLRQAGTKFTFLFFSNAKAKLFGSASIRTPVQFNLRSTRKVLERYKPSEAPHSMKYPPTFNYKFST